MARSKSAKANPALRLALIRQIHVYVSVFIAPSLIFFALTGALQTFRIPDRKDAPPLIAKLARVHRDDVFALKPPPLKKPEAEAKKPKAPPAPKPKPKAATTALKWFFVLVSLATVVSAVLGVWMALLYNRRKGLLLILLLAGVAVPVLLLAV
jgi:hypothetical protein